jgi:aspartyl-tRNA(Asn)/glutamyl-tRNA(Gln) amidotransferase subunit C
MAVTPDDVRHVADLARLGLEPHRVESLVAELNGILSHMDVLAGAPTDGVEPMAGPPGKSALQREDAVAPDLLMRPRESGAPESADGFFLVPRLGVHEDA